MTTWENTCGRLTCSICAVVQDAVPISCPEEPWDVRERFKKSLAASAGLCEALRGTLTSNLEVSLPCCDPPGKHGLGHIQPHGARLGPGCYILILPSSILLLYLGVRIINGNNYTSSSCSSTSWCGVEFCRHARWHS